MDKNLNLQREVALYRRRAILAVQGTSLMGGLTVLVFLSGKPAVLVAILMHVLICTASIVLAMRWRLAVAGAILAMQMLVLPTFLSLRAMGIFDAAMLIYPAAQMAVAVVAKPRPTAAFAFLTLFCASWVSYASVTNMIGNKSFVEIMALNPVNAIAVLVVIGFSGVVATYVSVILEGILGRLADHQATLEEKIALRTRELAESNAELRQTIGNLDQARAELVRSEKMAALGAMVAGISHELNTPIGNSLTVASTMEHQVKDFSTSMAGGLKRTTLERFVGDIRDGSDILMRSLRRATELVSSFKQVAVDQTSETRREFILDEMVRDIVVTLGPTLRNTPHELLSDIPDNIRMQSFPGPLGQVLTNLISNALIHGVADCAKGTIRLQARHVRDGWVQLTVQDDGAGIAPENLQRIFDPFFTTKLGQGGSGLGLSIVYGIVRNTLGGTIQVDSAPGEGARFVLDLPLMAPGET